MSTQEEFKKQILEEFGINELGEAPETHVEKFRGKRWVLRRMKLDDFEIVNNLLIEEKKSQLESTASPEDKKGTVEDESFEPEYMIDLKVQMAFVAAFLAAIGKDTDPPEDVPVWKAFGTSKDEELNGHHPLDPPHDIRLKTARSLYNYLKSARKLGVIGQLYMVYNLKFGEPAKKLAPPKEKGDEGPSPADEITGDPSDRPSQKP